MNCTRCNYAPLLTCMGMCVCVYTLCEEGGFCDVFHVLSCKFASRTGGMKINVNVNHFCICTIKLKV
jgi:hypothetical protein